MQNYRILFLRNKLLNKEYRLYITSSCPLQFFYIFENIKEDNCRTGGRTYDIRASRRQVRDEDKKRILEGEREKKHAEKEVEKEEGGG